jgi:hypothetical protein
MAPFENGARRAVVEEEEVEIGSVSEIHMLFDAVFCSATVGKCCSNGI